MNLLWAARGCCVEMWMDQNLMLHAGGHCTLCAWFPAAVGCYLRGWLVLYLLSYGCGYKKSCRYDAFGGRCSQEKGNDFSVVAVVWWDKHKCRRLRLGFSSRSAADWQDSCGPITGSRHKPHLWPPALGQFSCSLESTWGCSISCSPAQRLLRVQSGIDELSECS